MPRKIGILGKYILYLSFVVGVWVLGVKFGFSKVQALSLGVFSASILGTLFFWEYRLSFALLGSALLILMRVVKLEEFVNFASLEIILFLIGMMIITGNLKELGFFDWILSKLLKIRKLTPHRFVLLLIFSSALTACALGEVSSIIFMVILIFTICDYFEVNPIPYVILSVLATNVGSSGTVLGNPIGILIATKAGLDFEKFLVYSFPLMLVLLVLLYFVSLLVFARPLRELSQKIELYGPNETLAYLIKLPAEKNLRIGITISLITFVTIALHHRLELALNLELNTILLVTPLVSAGILMIWRKGKARVYVEHEVEWWTILFFLFLFAQSGVLEHTGVTEIFAGRLFGLVAGSKSLFIIFTLILSAIISSMLDNVILVAAFIPILKQILSLRPEFAQVGWWVLLYGACIGGNLTYIGSTANIVALGILEKERKMSIKFFRWFIPGLISTLLLLTFSYFVFRYLSLYR